MPLAEAAGRVAAEPARSAVDLPPFDRSAMDGYAVRAADTAPGVPLRLAGGVPAGEVAAPRSSPARRCTLHRRRAPAGRGRDPAVRARDERDGPVAPGAALEPGTHVRSRGEDVRAGDVLARAGDRLSLPRISALASAGVGAVAVTAARGCTCWSPAPSCCRSARRPSRGASTSPTA